MIKRKNRKIIKEADLPTDDDFGTDWDTVFDEPETKTANFADPTNKGSLSTGGTSTNMAQGAGPTEMPKFNIGDKAATRAATAGITPTDAMRDAINSINIPDDMLDMDDMDDMDDDTANAPTPTDTPLLPRPISPENLPDIIHREIAMSDPHAINPVWHKVANLPGNMSRAILTLGKALFRAFTRTPTKDIIMIGNVGGQGPNSTREVRAVGNWIVKHGRELDTAEIDFGVTIPGYSAHVKQYVVNGIRFMIVSDSYGSYIYAWPHGDSVDNAKEIAAPTNTGATPHRSLMRR